MESVFHEYFEISESTTQRTVGSMPFYKPHLNALNDYDVFLMGTTDARERYKVERRGAPYHIVLIAKTDGGTIYTGGNAIPLPAGHFAVLPANHESSFALSGDSWQLAWVLLQDTARWSALRFDAPQVRPGRNASCFYHAVSTLCEEAWLAEAEQSFATSVLTLVMQLFQRELDTIPHTSDIALRLQRLFSPVLLYPARPWRVDKLAIEYGVSVAQFQRLCVQHLGITPQQILLTHRMNRAMEMLQSGAGSVSEISAGVGYEEVASFSRQFSKHFGMTPSLILKQRKR